MNQPGSALFPVAAPPARRVVCPIDRGRLEAVPEGLCCNNRATRFPDIHGVPVLLNEANSVFRISDHAGQAACQGTSGYGGTADRSGGLRRLYRRLARQLSEAPIPGVHIDPMLIILAERPEAEIRVIGSGERQVSGRVSCTDVGFARDVHCICDAHDLPFPDASFDAVLAGAVLEHVCDPQCGAAEIHLVLKPGGFVWAVTPFLQPVHMGAYDFTRFTPFGHRRLFRWFDAAAAGMAGGPVYSAIHLLRNLALSDRQRLRSGLQLAALPATYPLRHQWRLRLLLPGPQAGEPDPGPRDHRPVQGDVAAPPRSRSASTGSSVAITSSPRA